MQTTAQQPTLQANAQQQAEQEMMFNIIASLSQSQSQSGLFGGAQVDDSAAPNFGGTATRGDLQGQYQADPHLQSTFGSFDNYIAYMTEASPMLGGLDWWNSTGIDKRTQAGIQREGDDLGASPGQVQLDDLRQSNYNARQSGYNTWLNSAENQAFMQKYGIEPVIVDEKGDTYTWTGNGYMRTDINEDSRLGANDVIKAGIVASLGAGLAGAAAPALGGSLGLGAAGTGAIKGAGGALISGLIQGDGLDPKSILLGAATGGLGGALSNTNGMLGGFINTGSDIADDAIKGALTGAIGGALDGDILEGALYGAAGGAATNLIGKGFDKLTSGGSNTSEWDFVSGDGWDENDLLNMDLAADDWLNSPLFVGPDASLAGYDPNRAIPFDDPRFDPTLDINSDGVLDADDLQEIDTSYLQTYEQSRMKDASYVTSITSGVERDANGNIKVVDGKAVTTKMDYYSIPGDDNNLYFEDGTLAATRDANGRWDIMDRDGNIIMNQSEAELGWVPNSGQINVQDQTAQNILANSEQVIRNPDTGEYMTVGGGLDAVPAARDEYGYYLVRTDDGRLYITDGYAIEPYQGDNYSFDDPLVNDGVERLYNEKGYTWQHVQAGGTLPNGQGPNNPAVEVDFTETTDPVTKTEQPEVETETTDSSPESTPTNSTDKTEKGGSSNAGNDGTPSQDVGPSNPTVPSDYVLVGVNSNGERVYENVITNIRVPESELPGEVYAGNPQGDPEVETDPTTKQEDGATGTSDTAEQGGGQNAEQDNGRGGTDSGDNAGDGDSDGNDLGEEGENDGIGDDDDEGKGADDEGSGDPGIGDGTGGSGSGGLGMGLMAGLGGGGTGENYKWQPIAGLTKLSPYQKRRHAIYNSLNEGLLRAALQESRRA